MKVRERESERKSVYFHHFGRVKKRTCSDLARRRPNQSLQSIHQLTPGSLLGVAQTRRTLSSKVHQEYGNMPTRLKEKIGSGDIKKIVRVSWSVSSFIHHEDIFFFQNLILKLRFNIISVSFLNLKPDLSLALGKHLR